MKINALLMDEIDNVVTSVTEIPKGTLVVYAKGKEILTLEALENIPFCHKVALCDIKKDEVATKYGNTIGKATEDIFKGGWVSHLNIVSVPRDYASEYIKENN